MKIPVLNQQVQLPATRMLLRLRTFLGWTGTHEQEQAVLRISILSSVLLYLLANEPASGTHQLLWSSSIRFISILLTLSFAIYGATILWPSPSHAIRIIGILTDSIGQSYALYLTGPIGAPWYGLYLWFVLGNGFRYGERYLYFATAIALTGFTLVALCTPYWVTNSELAIGLAFTLLLIPAYSAILIRRLNEARQRADAASRAKSDFLSCMSHEIRTPLNGILGMADLLRLRPLLEYDKDCVETIHVSAQALARQINEILDLSKIEAGKMTIETIEFDLHVLINTTLRIFQTQAQNKGLALISTFDPSTPYHLSGDPHKIRQVIANLVSNALKFTQQGTISLQITPVSANGSSTLIRFEVTDTGTGIPQDQLQLIFDPFTQANESISRNYGGTGLGTTICKNLVELMGGTIGVESTLGIGTTFWFEIPFSPTKNGGEVSVERWASRCRAIYVSPTNPEDDATRKTLAEWGISYDACTTIEDAYKRAKASDLYDALIINGMPASPLICNVLDGTDNSLPTNLHIVLIDADKQLHPSRFKRQSLFVIDTPMQDNRLLNVLHACYSKHATEDEIFHFARKQLQVKSIGRRLNVLVCDDNAINRIVMQRMLDKLGHRHVIVNGGEAALLALEKDRFDAVIIDKNMPDMGGVEVYQTYCMARGGISPVEFAILTADATEESKKSCAAGGIKHFLTKPVTLARLTETLSTMCGSPSETEDRMEPVTDAGADYFASAEIFDETEFERLNELSGSDLSFIRTLIESFVEDTNRNLRGLEAAVASGDLLGFRDLAHALKGSARYLGLKQIADMAQSAQNISEQNFRNTGIRTVVSIRKAANSAFRLLQAKLSEQTKDQAVS